jgi:ATP phosphoribosyltransferase regulatory subunit
VSRQCGGWRCGGGAFSSGSIGGSADAGAEANQIVILQVSCAAMSGSVLPSSSPPVALPSLPAGVRDFLPKAAARRRALGTGVMQVFDRWGYQRIVTPAFEVADVLERGLGVDARAAAIRFVEPGSGQIVALRPDITPQIARVIATRMRDAPLPIRLSYEGTVLRLANAAQGQREIMQAGIEFVGAADSQADAEVLAIASDAMNATGLPAVTRSRLDLGHVAPVRFVLASCTTDVQRRQLTAALARKDKGGVLRLSQQLSPALAALANALTTLSGPADEVLQRATGWPTEVTAALQGLKETVAAYRNLATAPLPMHLDLGDVRGFEYYTAMRFAGYIAGASEAIAFGGRYDQLIGKFGNPLPAVGFAFDIEAIAQAHKNAGLMTARDPAHVILVGSAAQTSQVAKLLRQQSFGVSSVSALPEATIAAHFESAGADAALDMHTGTLITARKLQVHRAPATAACQLASAGNVSELVALLSALSLNPTT